MWSNDTAPHYPPRWFPPRGHDRAAAAPVRRPGVAGAGLDAPPWGARPRPRAAGRHPRARPGGVDGPGTGTLRGGARRPEPRLPDRPPQRLPDPGGAYAAAPAAG